MNLVSCFSPGSALVSVVVVQRPAPKGLPWNVACGKGRSGHEKALNPGSNTQTHRAVPSSCRSGLCRLELPSSLILALQRMYRLKEINLHKPTTSFNHWRCWRSVPRKRLLTHTHTHRRFRKDEISWQDEKVLEFFLSTQNSHHHHQEGKAADDDDDDAR